MTSRGEKYPLFVYGSLKRGFVHHEELAGAELLGPARTRAGWALVRHQGYPALVAHGSERVSGELYLVGAELLARLDRFEEVPTRYRRERVPLEDGTHAFAYVIGSDAELELLPGGVWTER